MKNGECANRDHHDALVKEIQDDIDAHIISDMSLLCGEQFNVLDLRKEMRDNRKAEMPEECSMFLEQIVLQQ